MKTTDDLLNPFLSFNLQFGSDKPDTRFGLEVSLRSTLSGLPSRPSCHICHFTLLSILSPHSTPYAIQIQDVTEAVESPPIPPQSHDVQSVWECIVIRKDQDTAFGGADHLCRGDHEDGVVSELANLSEYMRSKF